MHRNIYLTLSASAIALTILCSLVWSTPVHAHAYSTQLKAQQFDEVDKTTQAALAANPKNVEALLGRIDLLLAQGQENQFDEAARLAEQCIEADAQRSECHEYLGNALGTKALHAGILSMVGSLGKIRNAFKKAIELNIHNLDARFALFQYYQQAPVFVGGGKGHARDLMEQTAKIQPDAAKLMQAGLDLAEKEYAKVEAALKSPLPADPYDLKDRQRDMLMSLGSGLAREKNTPEALRIFGDLQKRFPDSHLGHFGAGRTYQEDGKCTEAIAQFEKALSIKATAPTHYRMGQCWQASNDTDKALASFDKALAFKPALGKKQRSDALNQLKELRR
jgi:tetratricopeptide (TPR) repeat protein